MSFFNKLLDAGKKAGQSMMDAGKEKTLNMFSKLSESDESRVLAFYEQNKGDDGNITKRAVALIALSHLGSFQSSSLYNADPDAQQSVKSLKNTFELDDDERAESLIRAINKLDNWFG